MWLGCFYSTIKTTFAQYFQSSTQFSDGRERYKYNMKVSYRIDQFRGKYNILFTIKFRIIEKCRKLFNAKLWIRKIGI